MTAPSLGPLASGVVRKGLAVEDLGDLVELPLLAQSASVDIVLRLQPGNLRAWDFSGTHI